jgi:hemin uptake protein HemP
MSEPSKPPGPQEPEAERLLALVVDAQQLFRGRREVVIEHEGVRYRLRITRRNKLILQK